MTFNKFKKRAPQKVRYYFYYLISIPLVLLARLIKPIVHIRFGLIGVEAIGHLTTYSDIYFCEQKLGLNKNKIDIFGYFYGEACNQVLLDMILAQNKNITIFRHFGYALYKANTIFKGAKNHIAGMKTHDHNATILECPPIIKFSRDQEEKAKETLKQLGINENYICVHARDNAYKARLKKVYHQDIYSEKRNTDIKTYFKASKWLFEKKNSVVRIGVLSEFKIDEAYIFDYSFCNLDKKLKEFIDLYLQYKSKFIIIGDTGLANVSRMFRVPTLAVNLPTPILSLNNYSPNSIFITQKYFSRKLNRNITYSELFSTFNGEKEIAFIDKLIERYDVTFIKNTDEEVLLATQEMYYKTMKQWKIRSDEKKLQDEFWRIFKQNMPEHPHYANFIYYFLCGDNLKDYSEILYKKMNITISYTFLKNNMALLK